ncbi:MAG TPA: hypothetical protein VKB54_03630 [Solirubrobacteraceae bacterium]|nr:hypothetical protein [Solirubrobacteraceae bacterium]
MRRGGAIVTLLAAAALAPAAGATVHGTVDASGLTLTDITGTADHVTLDTNKTGIFATVSDGTLVPACPLTSAKFHGFQCAPAPLVRLDVGGGNDEVDASRLATPLQATLGPGSDVLVSGSGNDTIATIADGVRDVVVCGAGNDVVEGVADPNDDISGTCETARRSFTPAMLPKTVTAAAPATMTLRIGRANVALGFAATLATAPPKGGKARTLARTTVPATTGPVKLTFKLPKLSRGFLSKRPSIRVQASVTAIGADGRRYPLSLHSQPPGPHPKLTTLFDNQVRLVIPARLRHPRGR